jgi:trigger factor
MYTFEKKDKQGILNVKISKEEWESATQRSYEKNKSKFKVQGFRNGKAPRKVIEQTYGDTVFFDDAFDEVISAEYSKFLQENTNIVPAGHPHVDMNSFTVDNGIDATLKFDLMPEFNLPSLENLGVKKEEVKVTDEEIDRELESAKQSHARYVEEEKSAENGDYATIDFVGYVDGEKFEGGEAKDYRLELGSHTFIDGFEDQVVRMNKGEEKDVNVTFPKDYQAENLKGKPAVFKVTLKKVEKKVLPEIDDKFVSDTTEFETLEEYKKSIKENLEKVASDRVERDYEVALVDKIADLSNIELSDSMIDHELEHIVEDFEHRLSHQGMTLEMYLGYLGQTLDQFKAERRVDAEKNIKTRLVLQRIISENKISVTNDDLENKINEFASRYNMTADEFKKSMSQDDYAYIENNIVMTKVMDLIKSKN